VNSPATEQTIADAGRKRTSNNFMATDWTGIAEGEDVVVLVAATAASAVTRVGAVEVVATPVPVLVGAAAAAVVDDDDFDDTATSGALAATILSFVRSFVLAVENRRLWLLLWLSSGVKLPSPS